MAKGVTHFNHAKYVAIAVEASGWTLAITSGTPAFTLAASVGNVLGMLLTPDMDDPGTTYPEYLFGWLLRNLLWHCGVHKRKTLKDAENVGKKFLAAVTAPYGVFIPHRSWLSHLPPVGTLTKLSYLYGIHYLFSCVIGFEYVQLKVLYTSPYVWYTFLVWVAHDTAHLIDDGGMILFNGKKRYLFGYYFYDNMRKRNDVK